MKRTVTLEIAGSRYRMASDADEDHLRRLADLVNARVEALGPRAARVATPAQLLAMVALDLADDLCTAESDLERVRERTRAAIAEAIARIDARLEEGTRGAEGRRPGAAPGEAGG